MQCKSFQRFSYVYAQIRLVTLAYCSTLQVVYTPDGGSPANTIVRVPNDNPPSTDYTVRGLEPGTRYTIRVRATNEAGTGVLSNTAMGETDLGGEYLIIISNVTGEILCYCILFLLHSLQTCHYLPRASHR